MYIFLKRKDLFSWVELTKKFKIIFNGIENKKMFNDFLVQYLERNKFFLPMKINLSILISSLEKEREKKSEGIKWQMGCSYRTPTIFCHHVLFLWEIVTLFVSKADTLHQFISYLLGILLNSVALSSVKVSVLFLLNRYT